MNTSAAPIRESERLSWIDAARGLAILGIFMVNVPAFNAPYFLYGGESEYWTSSVSHTVQSIIDIFFQASFYTLFSFMFGFGMQMMKDRLEEKQVAYRPVIFRRLLILIGFGLVHAFLIWHGDILLSYGTLGLLLFVFFNASPKTLLLWSYTMLALLVLPLTLLLFTIRGQFGGMVDHAAIQQAVGNYSEGHLLAIWQQNLTDWLYAHQVGNLPFLALSLLPMFLLGMYVCKKHWLHDPDTHRRSIIKVWLVTGVLFLSFKAGPYMFGNPEWFGLAQDNIGGTASAIFYVLSITLLFRTKIGSKIAYPLTWIGRMSLSNYIFQSIISFFIFYSVGLGLYGKVTPLWSVIFVIVVFSIQILASKLWLHHFKYGPLEWLWRSLTYNKKQPFRRKTKDVF
ncbi:DUF418 domain-containing protein [Halobacillus yeomjeoni]|uniref:DUF418 domain-containing protein n=1 Tax=Halobacillus yeomjeoni TaxID=311194 RepID=A0A931MT97_9BACI|nr:DUF418 domain-containing protein [Halobacillus yeomjeoni]MBH0228748.1 DUF418 domain-containing protein [Halobacillus yeomjeoni]